MIKLSKRKKAISFLSLVLVVSVFLSSFLSGSDKNKIGLYTKQGVNTDAADRYSIDSSNIVPNAAAKREDYDNNLEYLLARDGFIYGIDYPWQGMTLYSDYSLGDQNIFMGTSGGATFSSYIAYNDIYNMKALGFNATNYWLLTSLQGVTFDENGYCTGVQDNFMKNLRDLLQICREVGMMIIPTLQPHGEAESYGGINSTTGLAPQDVWNKYFKFIWQDKAREAYMTNVIDPICELLAEYQDTILMVGLTIENSAGWVNDVDYGYAQLDWGASWDNFANFSNDLNSHVKKYMPNMLTSTEEPGGTEKLYRYNDLDVDVLGANYYHSHGGVEPRESYFTNRPGYVGECNIADGSCEIDISGDIYGKRRQQFIDNSAKGGWLGCFLFAWSAEGDDCNVFKTNESTLNYDAMYSWLAEYRYIISDKINTFRNTSVEVEKPTLLCNKGGNDVYWIPSRQAASYKIERSADGGKNWNMIAENLDPDEYSRTNGLIMYTDTGAGAGMTTCYRVTAVSDDGKTAVSTPNNSCDFFIPDDLVINGGFEDGYSSWDQDKVGEITTDDSYSGDRCLKLDRTDPTKTGTYWGFGQEFDLKPNTSYYAEYYYKCTKAGGVGERAFIRSYSVSNKRNLCVVYLGGSLTDNPDQNGWVKQGLKFTTGGSDTRVKIDINCGACELPYIIFLDEISLKEQR